MIAAIHLHLDCQLRQELFTLQWWHIFSLILCHSVTIVNRQRCYESINATARPNLALVLDAQCALHTAQYCPQKG